mgnify:CR=1 FL=1|tara:strand:+ start:1872 stop:3161 length:1290 start_codon:yes stop_codon:yes gene_type:complete
MKIDQLYSAYLKSSKICTDTRKISIDVLFFCLHGENFNGNQFAEEALKLGAKHVVVDDSKYYIKNSNYILVGNALKALQSLAKHHRSKIKAKVIAITGSNGKTTTKELLNSVLSKKYNVLATQGNLNNHIGVPLTILSLKKETEIGIIEMGANHLGEIKFLCGIAKPNIGYITNFGKAHLEGFGNLKSVVKAKSELYEFLKKTKGFVLVDGNDSKQIDLTNTMPRYVFGKNTIQDLMITPIIKKKEYLSADCNNKIINSNLIGDYNFSNVSSAIAFGVYFKISMEDISEGINDYMPNNYRSQWIEKGSTKILMDAYNANPTSMELSINAFIENSTGYKTVILGDMLELGHFSENEHQLIVNKLDEIEIDEIILIGKNFFKTKSQNKMLIKFTSTDFACEYVKEKKWNKKNILLKGSRSLNFEKILTFIK